MIIAEDGNMYIDWTSGIFSSNLGLGNGDFETALWSQIARCYNTYLFGSRIRDEYLEALTEFTGYESAYMFSSGTEAVEAAYKIARRKTRRQGCCGLTSSFHGKTFGAQIMAGREQDWRGQTAPKETACIILEPYDALTCQLRDEKLIDRLQMMRKEHGIYLIVDEIQAGFYRTGTLFGWQHYPSFIENPPDMVTIGKAMTNGLPGSAVLGPSELIDDPSMELSSTNGGNPVICAAGLEVIRQMTAPGFVDHVVSLSSVFERGLNSLVQPVRCVGMVGSIWLNTKEEADDIVMELAKQGLLVVHTGKNTIKLGPPLNITISCLENAIKILRGVCNGRKNGD